MAPEGVLLHEVRRRWGNTKDAVSETTPDQPGIPKDADNKSFQSELQSLVRSSVLTARESQQVDECIRDLTVILHANVEKPASWKVAAFGSSVNGFGSTGCDIDVVAFQDLPVGALACDARSILRKLQKPLSRHKSFFVTEALCNHRIRVPIIKMRYAGSRQVDLSVNNTIPFANTRLLQAYAALDQRVAELGVMVKLWAKAWGLCGAPNGRLSSYAFLMMVIYFLQVDAMGLPCLQNDGDAPFQEDGATALVESVKLAGGWDVNETLAGLFRGFFSFYATRFRWGTEVVSVRLGRRENSRSAEFKSLNNHQAKCLHIEDPFIRQRNLNDVLRTGSEEELWEGIAAAEGALRDRRHEEVLCLDVCETRVPARWRWGSTGLRSSPTVRWGAHELAGDSHRGKGHTLPRSPVIEDAIIGRVLEWRGKYGWLQPDTAIEHEQSGKHGGRVFVSMSDIGDGGGGGLTVGALCRFRVFSDANGLGAEDCVSLE